MRTHRLMRVMITVAFLSPAPLALAQHEHGTQNTETRAQVPALNRFHTPIYKLWHTAWPEKDTAMMAALIPAIETGVAGVVEAELPGILRDKKALWEENVKQLQAVTAEYRKAMEGSETQPKMDAAEKLHMQYERLVRIVRPVLKEIEAFHSVLYMLYHYYLPEKQTEKIARAAVDLQMSMDSLNAASLPTRLKKREEAFVAARAKLSASVAEVRAVIPSNDEKKITQAINAMHSDYQALERVFE